MFVIGTLMVVIGLLVVVFRNPLDRRIRALILTMFGDVPGSFETPRPAQVLAAGVIGAVVGTTLIVRSFS